MACIDDKGNLTPTAKSILTTIQSEAKTIEEIAGEAGQPLFKVRSSLRDMKSMGFVKEVADNQFIMEEKVDKLLNK